MSLASELYKIRTTVLKPSPKLSLVDWAEKYRHLSKVSSSEPGLWRTSRVEAARGPMLAATDPSVDMITIMASTQTLKTELINNIVGFHIHQDPSPIILVQPTKEMAEAWSKERLDPMLNESPALKGIIGIKHVDTGNKILSKVFTGGNIAMVGANAPGGLSMRPVRIVLCDEIDKYPQSAGKEGDPIKLVSERAATFWNRLIVLTCSPTIEGQSRIAQSYDESDQRKFFTPCPHCGHEQVMEWEQVKWPGKDTEKALYHCFDCNEPWLERQRLKAIQKSYWKATAPFSGHAGFHCSKLVSPWEDMAVLAKKFVDATGKREQMKTFVNTQLARTYKEDADVPDWHRIYERREPYKKNVIPKEACYVTMGVDVQGDRLECEIKAWGAVKNSWSLDYRIIDGAPSESETWDKLEKVISEEFEIDGARHKRTIDMTAIDSGYATQDVYYFCRRFSKSKVMVVKGFDHMDTVIGSPKPVNVRRDGKKLTRGQLLWPVGSSHLKAELYGWLKKNAAKEGEPDPYGYCHYPEYGEEFFKMLTAEELASKIVNGYTKRQWIKTRDRNESLDLAVYNRAAASALGIDRLKEEKLRLIAERKNLEPKSETEALPAASNADMQPSLPAPVRKKVTVKRRKSSWL